MVNVFNSRVIKILSKKKSYKKNKDRVQIVNVIYLRVSLVQRMVGEGRDFNGREGEEGKGGEI